MEQIYMIEIFIDKIHIFQTTNEEPTTSTDKNFIIKCKFGPTEFVIREGFMVANEVPQTEIIECDLNNRRKWSRTIRAGKSFVFPSYPDSIVILLSKCPLEVEVWNDDEEEEFNIFVGVGQMIWDTGFFFYLKETSDTCKFHDSLSIKQCIPIMAECCCKQVGEIDVIVRLTALGKTITTEFQQVMSDPEKFCFRTDKAPSMFQCQRIEGDNPNFTMFGSLYETATLEDPDCVIGAGKKIEVCTELQSCGQDHTRGGRDDDDDDNGGSNYYHPKKEPKKYKVSKIRMGDITGPCGNSNCPLAHKVKNYLRNMDSYKKSYSEQTKPETVKASNKVICGTCPCKEDKYHRGTCKYSIEESLVECRECGGKVKPGETCQERDDKMYGTGLTPKGSKVTVGFMTKIVRDPDLIQPLFGKDFIVGNVTTSNQTGRVSVVAPDDKECRCHPPDPTPPCNTFDCECLKKIIEKQSRKRHKAFCPLYMHKENCPVTMNLEDEEEQKEEVPDETEPLPYGLPPVRLGPCPVLGRPCSVPDGFARMYKNAALPALPPSYNEAGKVCCSKEFERIKKAIKDYMKIEKVNDYRCIHLFDVDTETRCCDKEQVILSLEGRACCGSHKMAPIIERYDGKK